MLFFPASFQPGLAHKFFKDRRSFDLEGDMKTCVVISCFYVPMFLSNFLLLSHVVNFLFIQFVTNNIKIVMVRPKRLHDKRIFILGRCWKVALCFEEKRLWNSCFHKLSHLVHWKLSSFSPSVFWFKVLFSFPKLQVPDDWGQVETLHLLIMDILFMYIW